MLNSGSWVLFVHFLLAETKRNKIQVCLLPTDAPFILQAAVLIHFVSSGQFISDVWEILWIRANSLVDLIQGGHSAKSECCVSPPLPSGPAVYMLTSKHLMS